MFLVSSVKHYNDDPKHKIITLRFVQETHLNTAQKKAGLLQKALHSPAF